jgi:hypothetical protein
VRLVGRRALLELPLSQLLQLEHHLPSRCRSSDAAQAVHNHVGNTRSAAPGSLRARGVGQAQTRFFCSSSTQANASCIATSSTAPARSAPCQSSSTASSFTCSTCGSELCFGLSGDLSSARARRLSVGPGAAP